MTFDGGRPPTPDKIKKYRHWCLREPGQILRHFGTADDAYPPGPFGASGIRKGAPCESAANAFKLDPASRVEQWKLQQAESTYARHGTGKG